MKLLDDTYSRKDQETDRNLPASAEKRRSARIPFTAGATVVDQASQTSLQCHTTDLSFDGCYLDTMNAMPEGTEMYLRLTKNGKSFSAKARVAYCQNGMGMGLRFTQVAPAQRRVLEGWLGARPALASNGGSEDRAYAAGESAGSREHYAIEELIGLLTQKHVMTEEEAEQILKRLNEI